MGSMYDVWMSVGRLEPSGYCLRVVVVISCGGRAIRSLVECVRRSKGVVIDTVLLLLLQSPWKETHKGRHARRVLPYHIDKTDGKIASVRGHNQAT